MNREATEVREVPPGYALKVAKPSVPEGYKQTEVGVIPEDWTVVSLGDCLSMRPSYGINAAAVPHSDRLPTYLRITDISEEGQFSPDPAVSVRSDSSEDYYLEEGDIVFARTGASVGKSYLYRYSDGPLVYAGFLIRVRPDKRQILPTFLASYVTTGRYWQWVKLMSMRSGQPGINGAEYSRLPVPLPSLKEQRAIATALSDVDALLEELDRLIAKKRDIKQATMQQLLTGQTRLPGGWVTNHEYKQTEMGVIPENWNVHTLRGHLSQDATYGVVKAGSFQSQGIPMLRGGDIKEGAITYGQPLISEEKNKEYSRTILRHGDVVIALVGYPGETAEVPDRLVGANISRAVGLLRPQRTLRSDFLSCFLNSPEGRKEFLRPSAGSAQIVVNLGALNKLKIPLPPSLEEQRAISTVLSGFDAELEALEQRRTKNLSIKKAMMQDLLTGRTRLLPKKNQPKGREQ